MNTKFINAILKKIINEDNELYVKKILKPEILLIFKHLNSEKKTRKNKKSLCLYGDLLKLKFIYFRTIRFKL